MVSVIIIARNEEEMIENCLLSVKWADEVIVLDNGSSDKTKEIAKKYTSLVFESSSDDFSALRNLAMKQAKGEWVLFVDCDERVLEPLQKEIKNLIKSGEFAAFAISRQNIIFGESKRYPAFWPDWVIRLIKKDSCQGFTGEVHEQPVIDGKLGYTKNSLLHLTHRNVDQVVLKSLDWSKIDARLRLKTNHPKMTSWRFLRILFSELFNQGFKRGGFFAGTVGTIDALLQVFSLVLTYIRLWEMQQDQPLSQTYKRIDQDLKQNDFKL